MTGYLIALLIAFALAWAVGMLVDAEVHLRKINRAE